MQDLMHGSQLCPGLLALYHWQGLVPISVLPSYVVIHICLTDQRNEYRVNYISLSWYLRAVRSCDRRFRTSNNRRQPHVVRAFLPPLASLRACVPTAAASLFRHALSSSRHGLRFPRDRLMLRP